MLLILAISATPLITYHFPLITYHFPLITYHFPLITYHFPLITYHLSLIASHFPLITSHLSLPTYHFPLGGSSSADISAFSELYLISYSRYSSSLSCGINSWSKPISKDNNTDSIFSINNFHLVG
jgi:hypothetical protein